MLARLARLVCLLTALTLFACKSPSSDAPPSSSSPPVASAPRASASAAVRGPATKLTGQQLKDAYAVTLASDDPFDKELAVVTGKLGDPQKVSGDTRLWWGWSPKEGAVDPTCYELSMSPTEGSSVGGTDWSKCGMTE